MTIHTERSPRAEELYQKLLNEIFWAEHTDEINQDDIRCAMDRILSQGKIEGRLTAYNDGFSFCRREDDRLVKDWQRIVDSV